MGTNPKTGNGPSRLHPISPTTHRPSHKKRKASSDQRRPKPYEKFFPFASSPTPKTSKRQKGASHG